jgi:hypothetical protein
MCELCERVSEALHAEHDSDAVVEELTQAEVEVARIQAERDVTLARIAAGTEKATVAAETDAELVAAKTEAETLGEVVDALTPDPEPAPAAPVVINDVQADEPDPADLPPAEHEPHEEPAGPSKPRGFFHD